MIDLHIHSTFSDGNLTPAELVSAATKAALTAIALTDHDSLNGITPFLAACEEAELIGIPGVEISVECNPGTMHMLGYFVHVGNKELQETLRRIRLGREERNALILEKLHGLGINVTWEDVKRHAGESVIGRPHFAAALVATGAVESMNQAFDMYLGKGEPAYADRFRLTAEASIKLIRGAGGVAVLGHPFTLLLDEAGLRKQFVRLKEFGLQGVEVYYPQHNNQQVKQYLALADKLQLVVTGGSDFHGLINPAIKLGVGFGPLNVPDTLLDGLYRAAGLKLPNRK